MSLLGVIKTVAAAVSKKKSSTSSSKNSSGSSSSSKSSSSSSKSSSSVSDAELKQMQEQYNEFAGMNLQSKLESAEERRLTNSTKNEYKSMIAEMNSLKDKIDQAEAERGDYNASNAFMEGSIASSSGNRTYDKGVTSPSQSSAPDTISKEFMSALLMNGHGNDVTVKDENGNVINKYSSDKMNLDKGDRLRQNDIVQYGGVSYVARKDPKTGEIYGERLMDYNDTNSVNIVQNGSKSTRTVTKVKQHQDANGKLSYEIIVENAYDSYDDSDNSYDYDDSGYDYTPDPPSPPVITYTDYKLYNYCFGIDSIKISYNTISNIGCFVSNIINIGEITDASKVILNASDYMPEYTSIEYYIIDGNKTIPILNSNVSYIEKELLFPNLPTRFDIKNNVYTIYKNYEATNLKLSDLDFSDKNVKYTISYEPVKTDYIPENSSIKVKAILRQYRDDSGAPYIKSISLIKSGGGELWEDISLT